MKTLFAAAVAASLVVVPARAQLLISEFLANPPSTDSPFEWVELVAASDIDFALTPYSVVFSQNGNTSYGTNGWVSGGNFTYGFSITSGTVSRGDIVYVGGSSMVPTGVKLRVIDTGTTGGDGFGSAQTGGVLGNGGAADSVGVFNVSAENITQSLVPVDAIFFGSASNFLSGYTLPVNDNYSGGTMDAGDFTAPDPAGNQTIFATGTYNPQTGLWESARTWSLSAVGTFTDNATTLTLVPIPEPSTAALMLLAGALGAAVYRRRK